MPAMSMARAIGLLGGTFDPVHQGHLSIANHALTMLGLDEVRLVPCHRPPHRGTPTLTSEQRATLLSLAVKDHKGLAVDTQELMREQASYTVDTLKHVREEVGDKTSVVFIMGADAFAHIDTWYQWQALRELAHIVVMQRPASEQPTHKTLVEWLHNPDDPTIVHRQGAGGFVVLQQPEISVSATDIRQQLLSGNCKSESSVALQYLPDAVRDYIDAQQLYGAPH